MASSNNSAGALSEETFVYNCTALCEKKNLQKEAVRACPVCKKYFCTACLDVHDEMLSDHNTVEPLALSSLLTEECKKHVGKMIDVWCVQHDALGCVSCAFFEHKSCEGVKDIPTEIKEIFKQEEFQSTKTNLTNTSEYLKDRQLFINEERKTLLVLKNKQLSKIEEFSRKFISMIEELEKRAKDELNSKFTEIEDKLQKVADECKVYEAKNRQCMKQFESCIGNEPQMFITMKNAQQTIALADRNCRDPVIGDCSVVFKPDSSIEQYLTSLNSLGTSSKLPRKYETKHIQEINVRMNDDSEECSIDGSCLLPEGSIVVADRRNKKLKHVDISSLSVKNSCNVPFHPLDVCLVGQKELAVAFGEMKIQFVSLGRSMNLSRTIDLNNYHSFGIAYHNEELFVSNGCDTIYVTNMNGSLLRQFTTIESTHCKHMAFSRDGKRVFSTCSDGGLVCTDRHGKPIYTYTNKNIDYCRGVCFDKKSSLFVCGFSSNNIKQLSSESGEEVGEIVKSSDEYISSTITVF